MILTNINIQEPRCETPHSQIYTLDLHIFSAMQNMKTHFSLLFCIALQFELSIVGFQGSILKSGEKN